MRVKLLTRFLGLFQNLVDNVSYKVSVVSRLAARDIRTNLGSNISLIREETQLDPWSTDKGTLRHVLTSNEREEVKKEDIWRCPFLTTLLQEKLYHQYRSNTEDETRVNMLINSLVIN